MPGQKKQKQPEDRPRPGTDSGCVGRWKNGKSGLEGRDRACGGERKRNGRGERKLERHEKATKDKRINHSSDSINCKTRQEMRQT